MACQWIRTPRNIAASMAVDEHVAARAAAELRAGEGEESGVALVGEAARVGGVALLLVLLPRRRRRVLLEVAVRHELLAARVHAADVHLAVAEGGLDVPAYAAAARLVLAFARRHPRIQRLECW